MDERMKSEITVLQEISSAIVHERNADALLNKVLDVLNRRMGMLRARLDGHGGPEESAATERKPGTNAEQHRGLPQIKSAERPRH